MVQLEEVMHILVGEGRMLSAGCCRCVGERVEEQHLGSVVKQYSSVDASYEVFS